MFLEKLLFISPCFLTKNLYKVTSYYMFLKYVTRFPLYLVVQLDKQLLKFRHWSPAQNCDKVPILNLIKVFLDLIRGTDLSLETHIKSGLTLYVDHVGTTNIHSFLHCSGKVR